MIIVYKHSLIMMLSDISNSKFILCSPYCF